MEIDARGPPKRAENQAAKVERQPTSSGAGTGVVRVTNSKSVTPSLRQANLFDSAGVKGKMTKANGGNDADGKKAKEGNLKFVSVARRV